MGAIQWLYNRTLRPHLPRKIAVFNGVAVKEPKLLDQLDESSYYENELIDALHNAVSPGDTVLIVGGGRGVSAVHAARLAGLDGQVDVYEASKEYVDWTRETVALNHVGDRVDVHHATVGADIDSYGGETAETLAAVELPDCDVVELDCEGAEAEILESYPGAPRELVVETHGWLRDASASDSIRDQIRARGYDIVSEQTVEASKDCVVIHGKDNG